MRCLGCGAERGLMRRVMIVTNPNGRSNGQAFVDFGSSQDAEHAMTLDRQMFGNRYLEVRTPALVCIWRRGMQAGVLLAWHGAACESHG